MSKPVNTSAYGLICTVKQDWQSALAVLMVMIIMFMLVTATTNTRRS